MTLTSLLNSTVQQGETTLDADLEGALLALEDGTYKVGGGTLTVATTEDDLDTLTGDWTDNSSTLLATDWFSGTETASQELIDFVTGLAQSGVYFAFDTDLTTVTTAASYTSQVGSWGTQGASLQGTAWWGNAALAAQIAAELQIDKLSFGVSQSNSGSVYTVFWDAAAGQVQTVQNLNPVISRTWANGYTAASTTTTETIDTLYWDGDSAEVQTFAVDVSTTYATDFTEGITTAIWDTNKQSVLGMTLTGSDNLTLTIV